MDGVEDDDTRCDDKVVPSSYWSTVDANSVDVAINLSCDLFLD